MSLTKKSILILFLAGVMVSSFSATVFAQLKIGYVQPSYIFSKYEPYLEAERKITEFQKTEDAKLEKEGQLFTQKYEDAQKQANLMSAEIRAAKGAELEAQRDALDASYDLVYNQDTGLLVQKQQELIAPIIEEINAILNRIGEEEEYDFILNPEEGGVLYANDAYDISDKILDELNKGIISQ
ncbi:OmpH family outer membrane protein [Candidatus Latescibacterota bacterium]